MSLEFGKIKCCLLSCEKTATICNQYFQVCCKLHWWKWEGFQELLNVKKGLIPISK